MLPFVVFNGPDNFRWLSKPKGRNRYKVDMWAKYLDSSVENVSINPKQPCTITELFPVIDDSLKELLQNRDVVDYGFKCYVWG